MKRVLFVCTGNTCRSPMAEAILKQKISNEIEVQSAGIYAAPGSEASYQAIEVLKERGITSDHRSQQLSEELLDWATIVLTMTANHKQAIVTRFPELQDKVFTLKEFALGEDSFTGDIADPFGGSVEQYRATADEIEKLLEKFSGS
ncbi:low molecular weight protein arginine phosphatase [Alkalihalobacterium chitinilyticum]|uniref:Low molecular weight protein arginine phosphatase n=1 Tax=Alkalihalobacterium chitinilyticum TaxID=2980103 RepID=A0ABT5VIW9_9BACI|nr:low molecular weight protein arginine phosphatase [Alkalihalobacterium chitinilyticum]MDE5414687.1 low molecular weight protein arginine phosphatase [Alkalihalobacterium chitinilyticum]